jgi:SAM-dependent methyltransferase
MGEAMHDVFRCPACHAGLDGATLRARDGGCDRCGAGFLSAQGVLSFVRRGEVAREKEFYDGVYSGGAAAQSLQATASVAPLWSQPWSPQDQLVLSRTLPLRGKRLLVLGNGMSAKEMHLLDYEPSLYIYSDLSVHAVSTMRNTYDWERAGTQSYFAAIDAQDLPFQDASLDVVYSYAMVHHLPDLPRFFGEVVRVLRPGGRAVFLDDAYAPLWHYFKQTVGRPLMRYSHRSTGISPEDLRFSASGGFRERELAALIRSAGAEPWFQRTAFANYLWQRAAIKLLPPSAQRLMLARGFGHALNGLDRVMAMIPLARNNLIRLAWGLHKPAQGAARA